MLTLAAADTLAAGASAASQVTLTVFGMELNAGTEVYKVLDQRQLGASVATIYTVPGSTTAFVKTITAVNNDSVARSFQLFRGGTAAANAITPVMTLGPGDMAVYEDGKGWQFVDGGGSIVVSQGGVLLNDVHSGYSEYQAIANPAVPAADTLRIFARKISGRMMPKWIPPSGVDNPVQPALFGNNIVLYAPTASTTVTGGFGTLWAKGSSSGTVDHPTPATTSPAIVNQMKRTRHRNVVTTTNQAMGIASIASGMPQFWTGNGAGLGGFFFFSRFVVELWPADTCRLFVGLGSSATELVVSDTLTGDLCGLWHDTADGANVLSIATRDNTTSHKTAIGGTISLAAGQAFDFYMYCKPNDNTIYWRLDSVNTGATIAEGAETNNVPRNTIFMGPQVEMSNGTANVTANTVGIGVNRIYVESDH